jgi:acyl-homoserine lactone acylase PvdQ
MRRLLFAIAAVATLAPLTAVTAQDAGPVQPYGTNDGGRKVLNILPPGQGRYMNGPELAAAQAGGPQPEMNFNQSAMYDSLVQATPGITAAQLTELFKDATFGVPEDKIAEEYSPREGVVVQRDDPFMVPHVYGVTRADVMFGAGYVSGEDRLFMMDTLRHVGRCRSSELLGASEANLDMDRACYAASGYDEEELQAMIDRLPEIDPKRGPQAVQDVMDYTEGVNQYIDEALADPTKMPGEYEALQQVPSEWLPTDTVAVASLIGSQLGVGGGGELSNAAFLSTLMNEGASFRKAHRIFEDLRSANDPEAPVTTKKPFPFNDRLGKLNKASMALPDLPQAAERAQRVATPPDHLDGPFGRIPWAFPDAMSNALLVNADRSKSGNPIAVMGPQTGYWSPQILMELDLHGPGIDARGVGFPGISQYVLLGRGRDYAWSATSAGGDQVDTFAEELCDPEGGEITEDSNFYVDDGECVEMYTRTDSWTAKPSAGGIPPFPPSEENVTVEMTTQRTDDGIVQSRGTVGGKPVAFVAKRASWGKEVDSAVTYVDIQDASKIDSAADFQRAFGRFAFTFNWFYVDKKDTSYQLGGYHPIRSKHTEPDFPVWGNGKWDWKGMLSFAKTPKDTSPKSGYIVSWNNKQAPRFTSNDANWGYSSIYRSQLLEDPARKVLRRGGKMTMLQAVDIMGSAATTDLRGYRVLKYMLKVVGKAPDERIGTVLELLKAWKRSGAHREAPEPGSDYEHSPAIAVMDAWWEKAIEAIFRPKLGAAFDVIPQGFDNEPSGVGSAYQGGFYGQVEKALRSSLGRKVRGAHSIKYCGKLKACRAALLTSLDAAVAELEAAFSEDPATWDVDETVDQINFVPVGIQDQDNIQWQNRPTFQQILEF